MNRKILIIATITLFLDQISKSIIEMFLILNEKIIIIKDFFSIHYIHNYGASWSLLNNKIPLIIFISILSLAIIYHFMYVFQTNRRNNLAFGLVVGGYVRDFLDFQIVKYHYPVFNIADIAIVVGILLLIIAILKGEDHREKLDRQTK